MKTSRKSKREFIFNSPFALKDASSRLRNLAQKQRLQLELEPMDAETYVFRITTKRWIPSSASGTLKSDGTGTLIQGASHVNWLFVGGMILAGFVLIPFQWTEFLNLVNTLQGILTNLNNLDGFSLGSLIMTSIILLGQLALAAVFYTTARTALLQPQRLSHMLEKTLSDAIPDLPQAGSISADGELMTAEDAAASEANARKLVQR